jgi:hypothetical protein
MYSVPMPVPEDAFVDALDPDLAERFLDCCALGVFLSRSVAQEGWSPPEVFATEIRLSQSGMYAKAQVEAAESSLSDADIIGASLIGLGSEELYFDLETLNVSALICALSTEIIERRIVPPWIFGDHAIDEVLALTQGAPRRLNVDETRAVSAACPIGVWQFGALVIGPFGLLRSTTIRDLPPRLTIGPIPCSDPGCSALHMARLAGVTCAVHRTEITLARIANQEQWQRRRDYAVGDTTRHMDDYSANNLSLTLANVLSEHEIRTLLAALIDQPGSDVRRAAKGVAQLGNLFRASGHDVVSGLDVPSMTQLLMLASDETICEELERLLDNGSVIIPPTEVRRLPHQPQNFRTGTFNIDTQLSARGVRFVPSHDLSVLRLTRLVRAANTEPRDVEDLEWHLGLVDLEKAVTDPLDAYVRSEAPAIVLDRLVMQGRERLQRAYEHLRYGHFAMPTTPDELSHVRDRMLWKLGFSLPSHPSMMPTFWIRIASMRSVTDREEPWDERQREVLRSEAVNLLSRWRKSLTTACRLAHGHFLRTITIIRSPPGSHFVLTERALAPHDILLELRSVVSH